MKTRSTKNAARPLMTKKAKNSRSPRRMACCGGSARQRQAVAHAAVGGDEVLLRRLGAQLGAQGLDVRIHGAVRAVAVLAPDAVEQELAAEDAPGALQQAAQQLVLAPPAGADRKSTRLNSSRSQISYAV